MNNDNFPNPGLSLGPNSCNTGSVNLGNQRAIHCLIGSRAGYTSGYVDARVNCDQCPCEPVPNTNFECREFGYYEGRCFECDACDPNPCSESWQDCTHLTCDTHSCTCDNIRCGHLGGCASCGSASISYECDSSENCIRTGNVCVEGSCGAECNEGWESSTYYECVDNRWLGSARDRCGGDAFCSGGGSGKACTITRRWIDNRYKDCRAIDCSMYPGHTGACIPGGGAISADCECV
ncbi:MAG: hypothetical protein ACMXYL_04700 [Candidatus Woesearchaeota archaeon]